MTANVTGAVAGESLSYTLSGNDETNVGEYTVTPVVSDNSINSNYDIGVVTGNLTITKANATYSLSGDNSKVYDETNGSVDGSGYKVTLSNGENYSLQDGDVAIVNNGVNAGSYQVVLTDAGISHLNGIDSNYNYAENSGSSTATYEIKKAQATIIVNSNKFTFDGLSHNVTATLTGEVAGENIEYTLSNNGQINAGSYTVTPVVSDSSVNNNYNIDVIAGDLNIIPTKASYTLSGTDGKVYDGQKGSLNGSKYQITLSNGLKYNLQNNDIEIVQNSANVGTYSVQLSDQGLQNIQKMDSNYIYSMTNDSANYVISKKAVTITVKGGTYSNSGKPIVAEVTVVGTVNGDTIDYSVPPVGPNSGTYTVAVQITNSLANDNYQITVVDGIIKINPVSVKPTKPVKPVKPVEPVKPVTPTKVTEHGKPTRLTIARSNNSQPQNSGQTTIVQGRITNTNNHENNADVIVKSMKLNQTPDADQDMNAAQKQLPQTGEKQNEAGLIAGLLGLLTAFGLIRRRKQN